MKPLRMFVCDLPSNNQPNQKMFYLLYFWHKLDVEGYVQFTLAKLPDWVKANSSSFTLTSPQAAYRKESDKSRQLLASSIETVGTAIATHAVTSVNKTINSYKQELLTVQLKMVEYDKEDAIYKIYEERKRQLEESIEEAMSEKKEVTKKLKK